MRLSGNEGLLLFNEEKYFPVKSEKVTGTREEIAAKLFALAHEMAEKLRIGNPPDLQTVV